MAQARVTDYFSQSKRAGVERSLRSKSQKPGSEVRAESETKVSRSRPQRSSRCARNPLRNVREESEQLRTVQEEFLRVIDEAVSAPDHAEGKTVPRGSDNAPESPRTPKRTSAEAEFDLSSAVFSSATEQHSTAKKRLRVAATKELNTAEREECGRKTARKKLVLSKPEETEKVHLKLALFTWTVSRLTARAIAYYSLIVWETSCVSFINTFILVCATRDTCPKATLLWSLAIFSWILVWLQANIQV